MVPLYPESLEMHANACWALTDAHGLSGAGSLMSISHNFTHLILQGRQHYLILQIEVTEAKRQ